jgi:hypothetical protein
VANFFISLLHPFNLPASAKLFEIPVGPLRLAVELRERGEIEKRTMTATVRIVWGER